MKTMIKFMAISLLAVMMCVMLASCGTTLNGSYSAETKVLLVDVKYSYEFEGKNVTVKTETEVPFIGTVVNSQTGTYEIKDDKITFTWGDAAAEENATVVENGPFDFEKGKDYIKIGGLTLTKDQ